MTRFHALMMAALAALGTTAAAADARIVLRADTNRDGRVDIQGQTDEAGKGEASLQAGALVLANIDDDAGRCAKLPMNEARQACFDAADDIVNGDADLLDMAVLRTVPAQVAKGATATIALEGPGAGNGRLFAGKGNAASGYTMVTPTTVFTAAQLRKGLNLRLEAKTFVRDLAAWDGTITVALTVTSGGQSVTDRVKLRVAPLLSYTHADTSRRLLTSIVAKNKGSQQFRDELFAAGALSGIAGQDLPLTDRSADPWTQDLFEAFHASVPLAGAPGGVQRMQVLLRSEQDRKQQWSLFSQQGKDVAVAVLTVDDRRALKFNTYDSMGNLETIPPHIGYPLGRQILGGLPDGKGPSAALQAFLAAQQLQAPLRLDTSWLAVGHVDEFMSFVPAATPLGFRIFVADTTAAYAVLQAAVDAGYGGLPYSTSPFESDKSTLNDLLTHPVRLEDNARSQAMINANLARVMAATGATEADVVRIPMYFSGGLVAQLKQALANGRPHRLLSAMPPEQRASFVERLAQREAAREAAGLPRTMAAKYPGAVNWVVLDAANVALANQHAPVINGVDIMHDAITKVLAPLGITPHWVEDYDIYHRGMGEVHCGSNSLREATGKWWQKAGR